MTLYYIISLTSLGATEWLQTTGSGGVTIMRAVYSAVHHTSNSWSLPEWTGTLDTLCPPDRWLHCSTQHKVRTLNTINANTKWGCRGWVSPDRMTGDCSAYSLLQLLEVLLRLRSNVCQHFVRRAQASAPAICWHVLVWVKNFIFLTWQSVWHLLI